MVYMLVKTFWCLLKQILITAEPWFFLLRWLNFGGILGTGTNQNIKNWKKNWKSDYLSNKCPSSKHMLSSHGFKRIKHFLRSMYICLHGIVRFMKHLLEEERPSYHFNILPKAVKEAYSFSCSADYKIINLQRTCFEEGDKILCIALPV